MGGDPPPSELLGAEFRDQLAQCRQGDVLWPGQLIWLADAELPTSRASRDEVVRESSVATGLLEIREVAEAGVAVLTQTCDLMARPGREAPFIAVAPLVELDGDAAPLAQRGRMTRFAHLPSHDSGQFFADLSRITTIEAGVLRKATDVRVSADAPWDASVLNVTLHILFPPGFLPPLDPAVDVPVSAVGQGSQQTATAIAQRLLDGDADPWEAVLLCDSLQRLWSDKCEPAGTIRSVDFAILGTDDMTVDAYLRTNSFDLEFLSA